MKNKRNIKIYAGVGIMTMALLMHMNMNISSNSKTREVVFDNAQKIELPKNDEEVKKKGR